MNSSHANTRGRSACTRLALFAMLAGAVSVAPAEAQLPQPAAGVAQTYYVATTGNDSNSGTFSQPFRTLGKVASVVAAGDTVHVRGGVYALTSRLELSKNGAANARIVFQSYLTETATIDCSGLPADTNCVALSGSFIDFQGFEIRGSTRQGISAWGGRNLRIRNNRIHHSRRSGIYVGYDSLTSADVLIEGNTIYHNCQMNNPPSGSSGWPGAITIDQARYVTVTRNLVYENYGEGIGYVMSDQGLASQNEARDNYSVNIYLDNATNITVERNLVYSHYVLQFFRSDAPANGISMANEAGYDGSNPLNHNRIVNNIVAGARRGINYGSYELGGGLKDTIIAHNTVYSASQAVINIDADAGHTNTVIANNIFYQSGGRPIIAHTFSAGITFHHNLWYGGSAGPGAGLGDINANPLLANPGGMTAADYRLLPGSPAIDAAGSGITVPVDYVGKSRPQGNGYDIGAHEAGWSVYLAVVRRS